MEDAIKLLGNGGAPAVLAGVLWFLLTKVNPKLDEIAAGMYKRMLALEAAHDRNATASALRIMGTPQIIPEIKEKAAEIIDAAKAAETERAKA